MSCRFRQMGGKGVSPPGEALKTVIPHRNGWKKLGSDRAILRPAAKGAAGRGAGALREN